MLAENKNISPDGLNYKLRNEAVHELPKKSTPIIHSLPNEGTIFIRILLV